MGINILNTIYLGLAFLALFGSSEFLYNILKKPAELTRKYVHILTGVITLLFPALISNHWYVLILCSSFLIILLLSIKFNLLNSINGVERVTRGSILYPIIVYICFVIYFYTGQIQLYYLPILILAICDPMAAFIGKKYQIGKYTIAEHSKTLIGSFAFFATAFVICVMLLYYLNTYSLIHIIILSIFTALLSTIAEAISYKGYDNFTIPIAVIITLLLNFIIF